MEITGTTVGKGVAIVGGGSASGYGAYSLTKVWKSEDDGYLQGSTISTEEKVKSEPDFLFQVKGFGSESSEYGSSTFGYAYGRFMLNPDGESEIWEENEEKLKSSGNDIESIIKFRNLKNSKGSDDKGLEKTCKEIYKKTKKEVEDDYWSGVWNFCSVAKYSPFNVSEDKSKGSKYSGKWALEEKNGDGLFSTWNLESDKDSWDHIFINVLKKDIRDKKSSISTQFASINSGSDLLNACETAYKSDSTENETSYGRNVREYCVLDASITLSKYPTAPVS